MRSCLRSLPYLDFLGLPDHMRDIHRNKENFSVEFLEDTHAGKNYWGLVFYRVKSKILAYYRLGYKNPTSSLTLYALGKFIAEHRIPRILMMDSDSF